MEERKHQLDWFEGMVSQLQEELTMYQGREN